VTDRPALAALVGVIDAPPREAMKRLAAYRDEVAHELAEKIREERDAADVPGSPFTPHMAHGAAWAADLIDPEKED
jgi:hypothetical protein